MPRRSRRIPVLAAVAGWLMALALAPVVVGVARPAAQDGSPEATPTTADCTANLGIVRSAKVCVNVIHASPDAPAVDVYLNGALAIENLAFGTASGFAEVPGGTYRLQIVPTTADFSAAVVDVAALELVPANAYEIAAVGLLADITTQVFAVDISALPEREAPLQNTRIRIVHASPDAPAIDVSLIADDIAQRAVEGLTFLNASPYFDRTAGTYRLIVNPAGANDVALAAEETFEGGKVYSVYVIGMAAEGTLSLLIVGTTASSLPAATAEATPAA